MNSILIQELIIFSSIMVIFSFITSYITDIILGRQIVLLPLHSFSMVTGIFTTSTLVYLLFSKKYIRYKCNK